MKKFFILVFMAIFTWSVSTATAAYIHYDASNVIGTGTITYYMDEDIDNPPEFEFTADSGIVSENLEEFISGRYTISLTLEGLWVDFDEDHNPDFQLPEINFTTAPYYIYFLPLEGQYEGLS